MTYDDLYESASHANRERSRIQIYEVRDAGIPIYRGWTRKPLEFRLACHISSRHRRSSAYHERLSQIIDQEGRRDDLTIRELTGYDTERAAIEDGPDTLLNTVPGSTRMLSDRRHVWNEEELRRLGRDSDRAIADDLGISQTQVSNTRVKLGIAAVERSGSPRSLSDEEAIEVLRLRDEGHTYNELADRFQVSTSTIAKIVRGETYKHIDCNAVLTDTARTDREPQQRDHSMSERQSA